MRVFIAINFDNPTIEKLLAIQQKLKASGTGNFSRPENLHLTVLFLGEVQNPSAIQKSIDTHFHTPIELTFSKTGKFKENLYWVGIKSNPVLNQLYHNISKDLMQAGFQVDGKEYFSPHITLARQVVLNRQPDLSFADFSMAVRRVSLMKSERINGKLMYTELYGKSI